MTVGAHPRPRNRRDCSNTIATRPGWPLPAATPPASKATSSRGSWSSFWTEQDDARICTAGAQPPAPVPVVVPGSVPGSVPLVSTSTASGVLRHGPRQLLRPQPAGSAATGGAGAQLSAARAGAAAHPTTRAETNRSRTRTRITSRITSRMRSRITAGGVNGRPRDVVASLCLVLESVPVGGRGSRGRRRSGPLR